MMKNIKTYSAALLMASAFASCSDFLDTVPDNRAEIDTEAKVTSLLVSAYPTNYPIMMFEQASDNTADNGEMYGFEFQQEQDAYLWSDIKTDTDEDSPQGMWDGCYMAIASANHALQAIEQMGNPAGLNPQKGEALLCRAYAHFILANIFCEAYDPATASTKLGIPYATKPETEVAPKYERGTLEETYQHIAADLEEGLPLIDDNLYSVPKYHFNKKAAYAFATRFYLFYVKEDKSNYEKVLEYGKEVLGSNPARTLRQLQADLGSITNIEERGDAYISASVDANLLITPINTSWPYVYGPYDMAKRYGMNRTVTTYETLWADAPWNSNSLFYSTLNGSEQKLCFFKYRMYFEYTDKVNGIGYRHAVIVPFSTNETLLCCIEANILKKQPDYATAIEYMNEWVAASKGDGRYGEPTTLTLDNIKSFYDAIDYTAIPVTKDNQRTVKKHLNPCFSFVDKTQEDLIHCVLQMRRVETIHDGSRWMDVKRYGIEITHNRDGMDPVVLYKDDPRRAFQLPQDVIEAGLEANPRK
jgi:tetratricopeptide (TPR) repeat protein